MTLDPKHLFSAALTAMPSIEAELQFDVDAAIAQKDVSAVWKPEVIARFALLSTLQWGSIRSKLLSAFGKDLCVSHLDRALKEERQKVKRTSINPKASALPEIVANGRPLREVTPRALEALQAANQPEPSLFIRSGQMVYVGIDERERPSVMDVSADHLRGRMDRSANWIRRGQDVETFILPPMEVVKDLLSLSPHSWGLPPLDAVVEVPTMRADGTVLDTPGYDEDSGMLYQPAPGLKIRPIPEDPGTDEIQEALAMIDEAIGDFPFADQFSKANLIGLLLTPIIRPAISGCTPLALIDAPQAGTGKSLLADVFALITTGRPAAMMPFPREEEEMRKSVGSTLAAGRALVCFDNLEGVLQSPILALALTAKEYETRILGISENMVVPNRATWLITGNNIRPSGDMVRRCYHIRLDARSSRPYLGRTFRHAHILTWVAENRAEIIRALLMIARAWFAQGRQSAIESPLGSFESWHRIVAGALRAAGVPGFLGNLQTWLTEADDMETQWEWFLQELADEYPDRPFSVGEVVSRVRTPMMETCPFHLPDSLGDVNRKQEGSLERAIGRSFQKRLGKRFGAKNLYLERLTMEKRANQWRVMSSEIPQASQNGSTPSLPNAHSTSTVRQFKSWNTNNPEN